MRKEVEDIKINNIFHWPIWCVVYASQYTHDRSVWAEGRFSGESGWVDFC